MMEFSRCLDTIESHEFAAALNVASDYETFEELAKNHWIIDEFSRHLDDPKNAAAILRRVMDLSRLTIDPNFENPKDTALAVYVLASHQKDKWLGEILATIVTRIPQCWWAMRVSRRVLLPVAQREITTSRALQSSLGLDFATNSIEASGVTVFFSNSLGHQLAPDFILEVGNTVFTAEAKTSHPIIWKEDSGHQMRTDSEPSRESNEEMVLT